MRLERQSFLDSLSALATDDNLELCEKASLYFALYEKELIDKISFLIERFGDLTVITEPAQVRQLAAETIREAEYRWE